MNGNPVPHSRPCLGEEEREAVLRVLDSKQLAQGLEVQGFEKELAEYVGASESVALSSGTAALHLALLSVGAGPGKSVILPSYACVSLLNAVLYTGAEAVLVDCVAGSPDMDLARAEQLVQEETVAIVLPHLFGRAVSVPSRLEQLLPVLEDGTQSLGAGSPRMVGSCGEAGIFSFYATKMLAGGEAGAMTTSDGRLASYVRERREYDGKDQWLLRFNYKMTDLTAALLRAQLRKMPFFLSRRRQIAEYYRSQLGNCARLSLAPVQVAESCYRFIVEAEMGAEALLADLNRRQVGARRPVFKPIHHYRGEENSLFPHAQRYWERAVSIPLYPDLTDAEVEHIVSAVREACQ